MSNPCPKCGGQTPMMCLELLETAAALHASHTGSADPMSVDDLREHAGVLLGHLKAWVPSTRRYDLAVHDLLYQALSEVAPFLGWGKGWDADLPNPGLGFGRAAAEDLRFVLEESLGLGRASACAWEEIWKGLFSPPVGDDEVVWLGLLGPDGQEVSYPNYKRVHVNGIRHVVVPGGFDVTVVFPTWEPGTDGYTQVTALVGYPTRAQSLPPIWRRDHDDQRPLVLTQCMAPCFTLRVRP